MTHEEAMRAALAEAYKALAQGEVPVGAVVTHADRIIARTHNLRDTAHDPTAHAELLALREAASLLGDWRLDGCMLYVTLEPCPMCAGAIRMARLKAVYFGAFDPRLGCCGSVYRLTEDPAFEGLTPAYGGVLADDCVTPLQAFFQERRGMAKNKPSVGL